MKDSIPWLSHFSFALGAVSFSVFVWTVGKDSEGTGLSYHWESWLAYFSLSLSLSLS